MKHLFKSTKVIFNAHLNQYEVYYKNWFVWRFDSCYRFDERDAQGYLTRSIHFCEKWEAEKQAIERAQAMLETVEVWRRSVTYYV
jgi:hypothetical protein